jgi:hypothetical protein
MVETEHGSQVLADVLDGNLDAFSQLLRQEHSNIREYAAQLGKLVLLPESVRRVLITLRQGQVEPGLVQQWASFKRRGYIADDGNCSSDVLREPIKPIEIMYDAPAEERIAAVIARLDEIGDPIDGEIYNGELATMLHKLF